MTFEANSNLETKEFLKILPFNYQSAVSFVDDFLHGYMLEYQDKIFDDCVLNAEKVMENKIKQSLLSYHNCDRIVNLNMQIDYPYKRFNYCLLPVYFISKEYKDKNYTVVLNGQSGKLGNIPKDWLRVFLTILGGGLFVIAIVLLILFL